MPKRVTISENRVFERINQRSLTPEVKNSLLELYKTDEMMTRKILDCIDVAWRTISDKIFLENISLLYPLENYLVSSYEIQDDPKHVGKNRITIKCICNDSCLTFVALV